MQPFIEIINVSKSYSDYKALNNVSFNVPKQSIFGLLGPNGAGKTTLIRILNQITAPDEGRIMFDGTPLSQRHVSMIGYLPEERGLYKKMKVGEQAVYLAQLKGLDAKTAEKRLKYWFGKFEIGSWWNKKVEELSKGMQQKIQFIVTVIHEPKLLIFDEPFSGFDPINVNLLKNEILDMRDKGATILFSTHNMASVEEICDHITLINRSHNILTGTVEAIRHAHGEGVYRIDFTGNRTNLETALEGLGRLFPAERESEVYDSILIQLASHESVREVIARANAQVDIHNFKEVIPSMNEIFIETVSSNNHQSAPHND